MATTKIAEPHPTLAAVALDLSENCPWLGKVSQQDVALAAKRSGVVLKDGRLPRDELATVYFNLMESRN